MNKYGEVFENCFLKDYNTYKIDSRVKYLVKPYNKESLMELLNYLKESNLKYRVFGNGSNIILLNDYYDEVFIILDKLNCINKDGNELIVQSGCSLNKFVLYCINLGLGGLENLFGIPGTIGGAIVQNASCFNSCISDCLESVIYFDDGKIIEVSKDNCNFSYRNSLFKERKDLIIVSAKFRLINKNKDEMKKSIKEHMEKRLLSQPLEYPNAGSVFRNPINNYAGVLIEKNGLKDFHINDAYISIKHSNFIINKKSCSGKDIVDLINYVKNVVKENDNIDLELEQEIINSD